MDIQHLADLTPDPRNANRGTERGLYMLETSLERYGAGRSILVDKHGKVIAGNKTLQAAASLGIDRIEVIKSDGKRLIVVQREDLDLESDPAAKALAVADNRASEVGLAWEPVLLAELADETDLTPLFFDEELNRILDIAGSRLLADAGLDPELDPRSDREGPSVTCPACGHRWEAN